MVVVVVESVFVIVTESKSMLTVTVPSKTNTVTVTPKTTVSSKDPTLLLDHYSVPTVSSKDPTSLLGHYSVPPPISTGYEPSLTSNTTAPTFAPVEEILTPNSASKQGMGFGLLVAVFIGMYFL